MKSFRALIVIILFPSIAFAQTPSELEEKSAKLEELLTDYLREMIPLYSDDQIDLVTDYRIGSDGLLTEEEWQASGLRPHQRAFPGAFTTPNGERIIYGLAMDNLAVLLSFLGQHDLLVLQWRQEGKECPIHGSSESGLWVKEYFEELVETPKSSIMPEKYYEVMGSSPSDLEAMGEPLLAQLSDRAHQTLDSIRVFVLAHEMAHVMLGHVKRDSISRNDELACDNVAADILLKYIRSRDPEAPSQIAKIDLGISAMFVFSIITMYEADKYPFIISTTHPAPNDRLRNVMSRHSIEDAGTERFLLQVVDLWGFVVGKAMSQR